MNYNRASTQTAKVSFNFDFTEIGNYSGGNMLSHQSGSNLYKMLELLKFEDDSASSRGGVFGGTTTSLNSHFISGFSSKGANFNGESYLDVSEGSGLGRGHGTFIFGHEKVDKGVDLIFSNYSGDSEDPKGFEFGINNANKLFFEYMGPNGPEVFVVNIIPHKRNIYSVNVDLKNSTVGIWWWDASLNSFEKQSFSINSNYIRQSDSWKIGSGVYSGESGINDNGGPFICSGYVDHFLYFDDLVPEFEQTLVARSFYEELDYTPAVTEVVQGSIIGYSAEIDEEVYGVTNWQEVFVGYTDGDTGTWEVIEMTPVYGVANSGEDVYTFVSELNIENTSVSNPSIYSVETVQETTTGIISFSSGVVDSGQNVYNQQQIFDWSGERGLLYTKYNVSPVYDDDTTHIVEKEKYELNGGYPFFLSDTGLGYGPRDYTYLGARDSGKDYVEIQRGINPLSLNNFANVEYAENQNGRVGIFLPSNLSFTEGAVSLMINGSMQQVGELAVVEDSNFNSNYELEDSGDFGVLDFDGKNRMFPVEIFHDDTGLSLITSSPVIDIINTGERQYLDINDTGDYSSAPFSEVDPTGKQVFFNGQKIYEGEDYEISGGELNPIGDILGMTGRFFTIDDFHYFPNSDSGNQRGLGLYDYNNSDVFILDSFACYFNGVRLDPKAHVYHDAEVDLILDKPFIMEKRLVQVYNTQVNDYDRKTSVGAPSSDTYDNYALEGAVTEDGEVLDKNGINQAPFLKPQINDPDEILDLGFDEV